MQTIRTIFVEKKDDVAVEAQGLFNDLKENLQINGLTKLRILNCYDIQGLDNNSFEKCKYTIFSEPPVDFLYEESFNKQECDICFAVKYLPGQFDIRADSCMQCIQVVTQIENVIVETSKVYVLSGTLSEQDIKKIKDYCINPVDSMEAKIEKKTSLDIKINNPSEIKTLDGFIEKQIDEIYNICHELSLAMSVDDLLFCQKYFRDTEKRNPTETEIKVIDTYWSDHCRHTTFLTNLTKIEFQDGYYKPIFEEAFELYKTEREKIYRDNQKDFSLMDLAVMGMKVLKSKGILDNLDESPEINACSIVIPVDIDGKEEEWLLMFKNETHNHPTEIEPFGGAATCLGGAIRDPLSGRSYVYQAMRVTGSGDPRVAVSETVLGKLPQRKITKGAASGYSSYGNQIGLATGQVTEIYHEGYIAKRMEIGAVLGAVKKQNIKREVPSEGDVVILVGGRTGRDGCGGATGSSKEHSEESILTCGSEVQKGNAPTERKLQRLFRNKEVTTIIKRCNDFGAGGVCVAIGELSEGLTIDLDNIPKKYEGLDGTELAISESQERMAVVVSKENANKFIQFSLDENLEATIVAVITSNRRLTMNWRGNTIVNISRDFLDTNGVKQNAEVMVSCPPKKQKHIISDPSLWYANLQDLNVCSQKGLVEMFDSVIGAGTVLLPFGGVNQLTPIEAMISKIPVEKGSTNTVSMMSFGFNPNVSVFSPFHGAVYAVVESVSKIVATGGNFKNIRLTFQEYFERLGEDSIKWGKPFASLLGAFYAQMKLNIPSIGGKDSMSGTFKDMSVPPTLVSFAVNTGKIQEIISPEFKKAGNNILLLNAQYDEYDLPCFDKLIKTFEILYKNIKNKNVISAHTVSVGGVAAVISKMFFGNFIGANIEYEDLYNYKYGSFVVETVLSQDEIKNEFNDVSYQIIGKTVDSFSLKANGFDVNISQAIYSWISPLENVFPTNFMKETENKDILLKPYEIPNKVYANSKIAKPKVLIPVFPGTNSEYDMQRAFEDAGALVSTFVIKNLNMKMLQESVNEIEKQIRNSQIIAFPGGFSAGDEPEGSGKFIAAFFRNPYLKEAIEELLNHRDGLMLGICNGFQALIKLGLVPYGKIKDLDNSSPTLTYNEIGRHISCLSNTKVISNKSPWLYNTKVNDQFLVATSHGEGRFIADDSIIEILIKNNQIATQYVDLAGNSTMDVRYNPNGSYYAIEGITSEDGRILGKMGHSERYSKGIYKNVLGEYDQKIFKSGVEYFL